MTEPNSKMDRATTPVPILLFAILTLVFLLNDIGFIWATNAAHWLGVDYGTKVLVIALVLAHSDARRAFLRGAGWPRPIWLTLVGTAAVTLISIAGLAWIDERGFDVTTALQSFPRIDQTWLVVFDLTVGLALTAVAEELVFRRLYLDTFGARLTPLALYVLSAAVFAVVHWSNGLGTVGGAFVVGLMLLWLTRRTGSVVPAIGAHYVINLALFWP